MRLVGSSEREARLGQLDKQPMDRRREDLDRVRNEIPGPVDEISGNRVSCAKLWRVEAKRTYAVDEHDFGFVVISRVLRDQIQTVVSRIPRMRVDSLSTIFRSTAQSDATSFSD